MSELARLTYKNYMTTITALPGSQLFRHLYVIDQNGQEFDAARDGEVSCAIVVSSIVLLFGWIDCPHATVQSTIAALLRHGWSETKEPKPGDVILWSASGAENAHVGFYVDENCAISNIAMERVPGKHKLMMSDGRMPATYYTRDYNQNEWEDDAPK